MTTAIKRLWSRNIFVLCTAALFLLFSITLTPGSAKAEDVQLVVADILLPTSCDPAVGADVVSRAFTYAVYEGLIRYIPGTTDIEPFLAESYEISPDGLEYTFTLRQGVKFQDGSDFNAEAVKFSIDRIKAINKASAVYVSDIKDVEVIDDHKVKIILKDINPMFLQKLPLVYIVSPKYVKEHEKDGDWGQAYLNEHMEGGTGPYYLTELSPGEFAALARNEGYWRGWNEKKIDKVVWRQVKESATRRLLLEKGDIQISNRINMDDLVALEKNPNIKIAEEPSFATEYLRMNNKKAPFDDIRVRKAIAYAFDYKAIIDQIMHGRASTLVGPMPSGLFAFNDSLTPYETDLEKAKKILADAGYKPGDIKISFAYLTEVPYSKTIGEVFQSNLQQLGIEMDIKEISWVTLLGMVKDPATTPDLFDGASGDAPINDSIDFLTKQFHSKSTAGVSWNQSWYINPKVDELLDKAKREIDEGKRAEYLKEVQKLVHEDMPQVYMFRSHTIKPMLKGVMGYKVDPLSWGQFNFYDMYIEK